jgi:hypothetical protein
MKLLIPALVIKLPGQADKSAVGTINRPLQFTYEVMSLAVYAEISKTHLQTLQPAQYGANLYNHPI